LDNTAEKMNTALLLRTPLHALHVARGGKMVPFAGYDMPVQYTDMGVLKEHLHTRSAAGLFDVSHMGQALLVGKNGDPALALEKIVPGDIAGLKPGQLRYTVLLNDAGGIIDDLMVTRWDDTTLYLVVNAACKEKDFDYIEQSIGLETTLEPMPERALIALQGPKAVDALAALIPDAAKLTFMTSLKTGFNGKTLFISRSGYTGEDGFEISIPEDTAVAFTEKLLENDAVKLIGLGARDSLRLEAGLCLYGHDLDDKTTPIEANLKWVIAKRRREEKNFAGAAVIMKQMAEGTKRLRVGIRPEGKAPMREGTALVDAGGKEIGIITSGGFGPSCDAPVAMGYVETAFAKTGTEIHAMLRGQPRPCTVAATPFIQQNYKKD
jgi:aminomethyltransferase